MNNKWRMCACACVFSVVNCAAANNRIGVSASKPREVVVNFDENNDHAELIDPVTGEQRTVIVSCDAHDSLKGPINVGITGLHDWSVYRWVLFGNKTRLYHVAVARTSEVINTDFRGNILSADKTKKLDRIDGDAKIAVGIELCNDQDAPEPGATYQDTLTVNVEPAE